MKLIVLSDTHLVPAGAKLLGLDPAARLASAIDAINRDHADVAFVVLTGDLADGGEHAAYELLRSMLARLHAPAILLLGNHDRRTSFRAAFPDADDDGHGFVQSARILDAATLITIDTLDETTHAGGLCDQRLAFLERCLREAPRDRPALLFQHHPPLDSGLAAMDRIRLQQSEAEWAVFERTRPPDFMFFGHLHRPVTGVWRGIPFRVQRAVSHQVSFDLQNPRDILGTHEAPDYSLVTVTGHDITVLERSFLYDGPVFSLDSQIGPAATGSPR